MSTLTDHIVCSLAKISRDEFEIAIRSGELPEPLPRKPGLRRLWPETETMVWIECQRRQRRITC
jgi:hypothetical protein